MLVLPSSVHVNSVNVAAGHLSSASIYPACFAPYLLATACSDGHVYFWRCDVATSCSPKRYVWKEWEMMIRKKDTSTIQVHGISLHQQYCYCYYYFVIFIIAPHDQRKKIYCSRRKQKKMCSCCSRGNYLLANAIYLPTSL